MSDTNRAKAAIRRKERTRSRLKGSEERPRLSVKISNTGITAQIINDELGKTLASATSAKAKGTMTERAAIVGEAIAKAAKSAKVSKVVFDRGSKRYHGRVQAVADAARKAGLEL